MIIYGSRMDGVENVVYAHGVCEHCGYFVCHKSYDGRKWGHLYFIPLIPSGGHVRVLKECPQCNMGQHVPVESVAQLYNNVETLVQPRVIAAGQGEHTFTGPESAEPIHTGPFLSDAVEMLFITGRSGDIPGIIQLLQDDGATYEHRVASSAYLDLQGQPAAAEADMRVAAEALPDTPYPWVRLATFAARAGRPQRQLDHLQRANDLDGGQNPALLLEMTGPLEALQRYDELTDLLETCIRLVPELGHDKKFMKLQKKYAKKAAKQGR